ncbi:MAG: flagellin [Oscillospiraceae bacterium]|nr:flagellin [Oscillospiraceae bacterium]
MRVTNNMITRNYLKSLNSNLTSMQTSMQRINSGRRFTRISENLSDGARALKVRDQLSDCNEQKALIRDAQGWTKTADTHLSSINDLVVKVNSELAIKAKSGRSDEERQVIGKQMGELKDQMVQILNSKYAGRNMFGSSNNNGNPFTVNADGDLVYNGVAVKDITKNADGEYVDAAGNPVPGEEALFVDMGLGMTFVNGKIDERTAYKYSFSGLDIVGCGTQTITYKDGTTETVPGDLFGMIQEMEKMLTGEEPYNDEKMGLMIDKTEAGRKNLMLTTTDLGNRENYLEGAADRLEATIENLTTIRSNLEGTDDPSEITKLNMYRYSWLATLQMGSNILPQSLLDYLR